VNVVLEKQANRLKPTRNFLKRIIYIFVLFFVASQLRAQITIGGDSISYAAPKEYVIAKTEIEGVTTLDDKVLKLVSGLS